MEVAAFEVEAVKICDLQFAAGAGLKRAGQGDDLLVVKIEAGNGVVGFWMRGLFFEGDHAAVGGELNHTIGFGVCDVITEDSRAGGLGVGGFERGNQVVAVKEVVAEDEGAGLVAGKEAHVGGDGKGLGESVG